jgi:hypothetical protein
VIPEKKSILKNDGKMEPDRQKILIFENVGKLARYQKKDDIGKRRKSARLPRGNHTRKTRY